ncbi:glutamate-5-semialdehyde dehydrogenase [Kiritimatiellota bacterium B12222]|nr:glutamate-5-semialdehyde dehydrogenase [Kiritimatiellota bacterium B12222]
MIKKSEILVMGEQAKKASMGLAKLSSRKKNTILEAMADELDARRKEIQAANQIDLQEGKKNGLSDAMLDRLELTDERYTSMVKGILDVIALKDPVGDVMSTWVRPNGLEIRKVRVPIGVIGIIFESRPNVTVDAAVLCFKSSNATILRGGKEAIHSNRALAQAIQEGGEKKGLPPNAIQLVQTTNRSAVKELVQLEGLVDLVIPRGGESLIRAVVEDARVPVIKHYKGICHIYVDKTADLPLAVDIVDNAKTQRPGVCNAVETVLVHEDVAVEFLPMLANRLISKKVEIRGDAATCENIPEATPATEADWGEEYLDLILSIRVVPSVDDAIEHINHYGSKHSDAILTESESAKKKFLQEVDTSTVYVNASTRFTDGNEFGLGAEIGISTDKLHARGPMGLEELTTYKFQVLGTGQIR